MDMGESPQERLLRVAGEIAARSQRFEFSFLVPPDLMRDLRIAVNDASPPKFHAGVASRHVMRNDGDPTFPTVIAMCTEDGMAQHIAKVLEADYRKHFGLDRV